MRKKREIKMTQVLNIANSMATRCQTKIEDLYNTLYVDKCLGKLHSPDTQIMRVTDQDNTALKVIKLGITILTLGILPILFFGALKGCKMMRSWIVKNHEPIYRSCLKNWLIDGIKSCQKSIVTKGASIA